MRLLITITLLLFAAAASAEDIRLSNYQIGRTWDVYSKHFASRYVKVGDDVYPLPRWNPRFSSSRHLDATTVIKKTAKTVEYRSGNGLIRKKAVRLPREDAIAAATLLPDRTAGNYGYIHSFTIKKILDEDTMVIEDIWLVVEDEVENQVEVLENKHKRARTDRDLADKLVEFDFTARLFAIKTQKDREFRKPLILKGIDTKPFKERQRWPQEKPHIYGYQIAVVGEIEYTERRRRPTKYDLAIPTSRMKTHALNEREFLAMLKDRDLDKETFAKIIVQAKRDDPDNVDVIAFKALEAAKPAPPAEEPDR